MAVEEMNDGLLSSVRTGLFVAGGRLLQGIAGDSRIITRGVERDRVALTYDDGPHSRATPRVLSVLEKHSAKATFFCVGSHAIEHPAMLRDLRQAGHEIGSHTNSHLSLRKVGSKQALEDIRKGREVIEDILGESCPLFRPPHGLIPLRLLRPVWKAGLTVVLWTTSTRDYSSLAADVLCIRATQRGITSGDIVLMHDTSDSAPQLTDTLCRLAAQRDLKWTTISELIRR